MKFFKLHTFLGIIFLLVFLGVSAQGRGATGQAMIEPQSQAMPLLPFLDYILDPSMGMDIEEASRATGWQSFIPDKLPRQEGILWLRFTIAPLAPDARPQTFLLDMGQSVPGKAVLFDLVHNELSGAQEWRENLPAPRNVLLLPEASTEAIPCYIRLDGLPGPWFAPMIRTPQNAASNWSSLAQTGAVLTLAVVMFLCLLRGVSEKGQWRYWTAFFVGMALLQALLGMPALSETFNFREIAAIMSPGLALMLMPHACRHLLNAKKYSRAIDIQLFLLALPGAILAILPLIPGWDWLYRWLDLWPLAIIIFVPTALGAWIAAVPGARRFLLSSLIPPLFVAFALLGFELGLPANILASGPAWGIALAALLLAATRSPAQAAAPEPANRAAAKPASGKPSALPALEIEPREEEIIMLEHPLDDPNLRILPAQKKEVPDEGRVSAPVAAETPAPMRASGEEERENALREPIDAILREGAALESCALPPSARQYAEKMVASAHQLAMLLDDPAAMQPVHDDSAKEGTFNLQSVLRNAHDAVAARAEYAGIALSWYMPPHLGHIYNGAGLALETTLSMLLESSIRATRHGAVKVSVKRVPDSHDPGDLLFTVTDDGGGYPPLERSSLALVKAWELTGASGGYLSAECSQQGATIAFTAHFVSAEEEEERAGAERLPRVILVSASAETRRNLGRIIETVPCILEEAADAQEAVACQTQNPATLVITQGKFARPSAADLVRNIVRIARDAGIKCNTLAVTADESEWRLLKASGFTHAMLEPVDPEIFRRTVMELTEADDGQDEKTPPHENATVLKENIRTKDIVPSMLIEQNFPVAPVFEGPDWLGSSADENTDEAEENEEDVQETAREAAAEWVGEPVPLSAPKPAAVKQPASPNPEIEVRAERIKPAAAGNLEADSVTEWVGEPTPIEKNDVETPANPDEGQLLDFIVGVNEGQSRENTGEKSESGKRSAIGEFVESSANMVASTLSRMLRQKETPPGADTQPAKEETAIHEAEPIKARSDPAIIALLERLDAAMRHANAAFATKNTAAIAESTGMIADDAEKFGLRLLARMAKCVERAAVANDMNALSDLLPELGIAVERNRITLAQRK